MLLLLLLEVVLLLHASPSPSDSAGATAARDRDSLDATDEEKDECADTALLLEGALVNAGADAESAAADAERLFFPAWLAPAVAVAAFAPSGTYPGGLAPPYFLLSATCA